MERGILAVDVDGVLNAWGMPSRERLHRGYYDTHTPQWGGARITFNPRHGQMLLDAAERTGFELMWATAWEDGANKYIAPLLHLPELPVLKCYPEMHGRYWKFDPILPQVEGRPLAWFDDQFVDDEIAGEAMDWFLSRRRDVPTLLCPVDDSLGLTQECIDTFEGWWASHADTTPQVA